MELVDFKQGMWVKQIKNRADSESEFVKVVRVVNNSIAHIHLDSFLEKNCEYDSFTSLTPEESNTIKEIEKKSEIIKPANYTEIFDGGQLTGSPLKMGDEVICVGNFPDMYNNSAVLMHIENGYNFFLRLDGNNGGGSSLLI